VIGTGPRSKGVFKSAGTHGDLVYVVAHARAQALRLGVAFITGPDRNQVSIAMVGELWDVRPSSFFTPTWMEQVSQILNTFGLEAM
jgi:hypothetical protein